MVCASPPQLARRTRLHYSGDNTGNVIGPVVLPGWAKLWNSTYQEKKEIYGPNFIAVGGKGAKHERALVESEAADDEKRTNTTVEPLFFHTLPAPFWSEVINCCSALAVLDLTASDESLPLACLRANVPYTGLCLTSAHASALWRRINLCALSAAADEADKLYDSDLAAGLKRKADTQEAGKDSDAKPGNKSKRAKTAAKKKPKKKETDVDDELDPFGSEGEGPESGHEIGSQDEVEDLD
jgi:hypothetical protein